MKNAGSHPHTGLVISRMAVCKIALAPMRVPMSYRQMLPLGLLARRWSASLTRTCLKSSNSTCHQEMWYGSMRFSGGQHSATAISVSTVAVEALMILIVARKKGDSYSGIVVDESRCCSERIGGARRARDDGVEERGAASRRRVYMREWVRASMGCTGSKWWKDLGVRVGEAVGLTSRLCR